MRKDKAKNVWIVAKEVLANPLLKRDEIAEKTWLWAWTVSRALDELDESGRKDPRILWLTDKDFELMEKIQSVKFQRLDSPEEINNSDLDKWESTAVKRWTIFRGDATDKNWWLKNTLATLSDLMS